MTSPQYCLILSYSQPPGRARVAVWPPALAFSACARPAARGRVIPCRRHAGEAVARPVRDLGEQDRLARRPPPRPDAAGRQGDRSAADPQGSQLRLRYIDLGGSAQLQITIAWVVGLSRFRSYLFPVSGTASQSIVRGCDTFQNDCYSNTQLIALQGNSGKTRHGTASQARPAQPAGNLFFRFTCGRRKKKEEPCPIWTV